MKTLGYAAHSAETPLVPFNFDRRALRPNDIAMEVLYCGICHTDLHQARNDWGFSKYPMVPGHEFIGRVIAVGSDVTRHKAGDHVAVGCMVDSCMQCDQCRKGEEQLCRKGNTGTYNSTDRITCEPTYGGYSKHVVVREEFALKVPAGLDLSKAAPLLCAGITTYSPLKTWNVGPDSRVGVVGLGGLGHMAVKFAVAMGAEVTVISRSKDKEADTLALGAKSLLVSTDEAAMKEAASHFDLIIDTVPVNHDIKIYIPLLEMNGTLVLVGQFGPLDGFNTIPLILGRRRIAGSPIGSLAQTQECSNSAQRRMFCRTSR